jgi:hypothetical protein
VATTLIKRTLLYKRTGREVADDVSFAGRCSVAICHRDVDVPASPPWARPESNHETPC